MAISFDPLMNVASAMAGAVNAPANKAAAANTNNSTGSNKLADQQTFLRLLVAQLQTQDPLKPMDGTEFVTQLTQFSELERLISIDGSIQSLLQVLQAGVDAAQSKAV
jgi:flagellar basal-body rod modification protein FlgD